MTDPNPNPVSNAAALTAAMEDTTAKLNAFATSGEPLEPGQCEKLAAMIAAAQRVYLAGCPTL